MLPSGQFLKTPSDFPHANAGLDLCRAINAWPPVHRRPPFLYWTLRLLITPCSSFIIEMWMGEGQGVAAIDRSTGIFDCRSRGFAKALVFMTTKRATWMYKEAERQETWNLEQKHIRFKTPKVNWKMRKKMNWDLLPFLNWTCVQWSSLILEASVCVALIRGDSGLTHSWKLRTTADR